MQVVHFLVYESRLHTEMNSQETSNVSLVYTASIVYTYSLLYILFLHLQYTTMFKCKYIFFLLEKYLYCTLILKTFY